MLYRIPTYVVRARLKPDVTVELRVPQSQIEAFMSVLLFNRVLEATMSLEVEDASANG